MDFRLGAIACLLALATISGEASAAIQSRGRDNPVSSAPLAAAIPNAADAATGRGRPALAGLRTVQLGVTDGSDVLPLGTDAHPPRDKYASGAGRQRQGTLGRYGIDETLSNVRSTADAGRAAGDTPAAARYVNVHAGTANPDVRGEVRFSPAVTTDAAPEPGNWAMILAGLLAIGAIARRRMSL
jgi:MYXO-CTERM domain-containing protein